MFLWMVFKQLLRRLHSCLSEAVCIREASGEMRSVAKETFPYGLNQNGLQALLGASVSSLPTLKATIGHQEALAVNLKEGLALMAVSDKQQSFLMTKLRIGQTTGRKLDDEIVQCAGNAPSLGTRRYGSFSGI